MSTALHGTSRCTNKDVLSVQRWYYFSGEVSQCNSHSRPLPPLLQPERQLRIAGINPGKHRIRNQSFGNKAMPVTGQDQQLLCSPGTLHLAVHVFTWSQFCSENLRSSTCYHFSFTVEETEEQNSFYSQGNYCSVWIQNHSTWSHNHLITSHIVSQWSDSDFQSYDASVVLGSVATKPRRTIFFEALKVVLVVSRYGDPCTIHWGREEDVSRDFPPPWFHTTKDRKGPNWPKRDSVPLYRANHKAWTKNISEHLRVPQNLLKLKRTESQRLFINPSLFILYHPPRLHGFRLAVSKGQWWAKVWVKFYFLM